MPGPLRIELRLQFSWVARHSLPGNEIPHPHLWKLELVLSGQRQDGKLVDMLELRSAIAPAIERLEGSYLNEHPELDEASRHRPTSENLACFFYEKLEREYLPAFLRLNPTLRARSAQVALHEASDGTERGAAKAFCEEEE